MRGLQPVQKRLQLGVVGIVVLRVDVPDQALPAHRPRTRESSPRTAG